MYGRVHRRSLKLKRQTVSMEVRASRRTNAVSVLRGRAPAIAPTRVESPVESVTERPFTTGHSWARASAGTSDSSTSRPARLMMAAGGPATEAALVSTYREQSPRHRRHSAQPPGR
jgi:hypothetical protein